MRLAFDIDGTIANTAHRQKYAEARDWDTFHSLAHLDAPLPTLQVLQSLGAFHSVEIWTARPDTYREKTMAWLDANDVDYEVLLMRKAGDWRRAQIVKLEWYLQRSPGGRPDIIFEDHPGTVALLRMAGCCVHQVADRD